MPTAPREPETVVVARYGEGAQPIAVAHRGGAGLGIENTLQACRRSWALGITHLEFDVWLSRDDVPVVLHDRDLTRLTGRRQRVGETTLAELSEIELAPGVWIPTVADVLHTFPTANFMIDLKDPAAMGAVLELVARYDARDRVCFTGGWDRSLRVARELFPTVHRNLGFGRMSTVVACSRLGFRASRFGADATFLHVPHRLGRVPIHHPSIVRRAHELDLRVMVWGVEDAETMHRLLDDGVDGLIVDRPDLLRDVLISRDQWEPAASRTPLA